MRVSREPITKYQQMLCEKFLKVFGTSIYEVVNTTFFHIERRISLRDASTQFTYKEEVFTLSYETIDPLRLTYGFNLNCKDGESRFFPVNHLLLRWRNYQYKLQDFTSALDELSGSSLSPSNRG